jgi:spore coat polysaccharide biosynthesis predicted glycosyltransferase SpsG
MRIAVRVDVSRQIGTGHLRRMANLVAALPDAVPIYLIRTDTPNSPLLAGLPSFIAGSATQEERMVEECRKESPDVIVLDLLRYSVGTVAQYRSTVKVPVVTLHEYHDWGDASDLIVNYNTFDNFEECNGAKMLAGPRYCIIGDGVRTLRRALRTRTVLATFGGSDPSGFADSFVETVVSSLPDIQFEIYDGPLSSSRWHSGPAIRRGNVRRIVSGEAFFSAMATCGTAVTAAGNSMYEFVHLGIKPLVVAHNDHQAEFARNAERIGACEYMGRHPHIDWARLTAVISRQNLGRGFYPVSLIDGRGAERIARRIERLCR